jgi:hypothetical protein
MNMKRQAETKKKKTYKTPKLVTYGDVHTLTRNVNSANPNVDSNPGGAKKTS